MWGAIQLEYSETAGAVGAATGYQYHSSKYASNKSASVSHPFGDTTMRNSRGNNARTVIGKSDPNSSTEEADIIFIADWARRYTAKEGSALTGMTPKGFQKLQSGDNAISYKRLTQWMRNDPDFAVAHAVHVGLILPGQAESAGAFTRAVNAYMRREA